MTVMACDPGRTGAFARIDENGLTLWDMPAKLNRGIDLHALKEIVTSCEPCRIGIEQNTGHPDDVPDRAFIFGLQTGQIQAMFFAFGFTIDYIFPQTWMQKMGLPSKQNDFELKQRIEIVHSHFPTAELVGPRGGLLDGRIEAACICLFMKRMYTTPLGRHTGRRPPTFRGREPNAAD